MSSILKTVAVFITVLQPTEQEVVYRPYDVCETVIEAMADINIQSATCVEETYNELGEEYYGTIADKYNRQPRRFSKHKLGNFAEPTK